MKKVVGKNVELFFDGYWSDKRPLTDSINQILSHSFSFSQPGQVVWVSIWQQLIQSSFMTLIGTLTMIFKLFHEHIVLVKRIKF